MADASQGTQEPKTTALPHFLNPWLTLLGGIFAILGLIWTAVEFFNPIKDLDVTVIIEDKVEFSLPEQASSLQKLALTYDGQPIQKISLLRLAVINTGNRAIEPPKDSATNEWILTLRSSSKAPLVRVGELVRVPDYLYAIAEAGPGPDAVHLRLRVLNRKESVAMQVALIGAGGDMTRPIKAETPEPRVRDLNIAVAQRSVRNRIGEAFIVPLWGIGTVVLVGWRIVDIRRGRIPMFTGPLSWKVAIGSVAAILGLAFVSAFLAAGASWLLAWIVYLVAFR